MKVSARNIVVLDTGVIGLITNPTRNPEAEECRVWLRKLLAADISVALPEVADYELRRELVLNDAVTAIQTLEAVRATIEVVPAGRDVFARGAQMWANLRRFGMPTSDRHSLDIDVLVCATTMVTAEALGLDPVIATTNAKHISRLVKASRWQDIEI